MSKILQYTNYTSNIQIIHPGQFSSNTNDVDHGQ